MGGGGFQGFHHAGNINQEDLVVDDRDQEEVKILKWNLI